MYIKNKQHKSRQRRHHKRKNRFTTYNNLHKLNHVKALEIYKHINSAHCTYNIIIETCYPKFYVFNF